MHVYGRCGHSNQIVMIVRGCNEKHENLGKAHATSLENDDQKFPVKKIVIWFSGKIVGLYSEEGVQIPQKKFFSLFNISSGL